MAYNIPTKQLSHTTGFFAVQFKLIKGLELKVRSRKIRADKAWFVVEPIVYKMVL